MSEGKFYVLLKIKKSKKTLSGLIEKEAIKIDKDGNESVVTRPHKIWFIDSTRLVAASLWNLFGTLRERTQNIKCIDCEYFLE